MIIRVAIFLTINMYSFYARSTGLNANNCNSLQSLIHPALGSLNLPTFFIFSTPSYKFNCHSCQLTQQTYFKCKSTSSHIYAAAIYCLLLNVVYFLAWKHTEDARFCRCQLALGKTTVLSLHLLPPIFHTPCPFHQKHILSNIDIWHDASPFEFPIANVTSRFSSSPVEFKTTEAKALSRRVDCWAICARPPTSRSWRWLFLLLIFISSFALLTTPTQAAYLPLENELSNLPAFKHGEMLNYIRSERGQRSTIAYLRQYELLHLYVIVNQSRLYFSISDEGKISLISRKPQETDAVVLLLVDDKLSKQPLTILILRRDKGFYLCMNETGALYTDVMIEGALSGSCQWNVVYKPLGFSLTHKLSSSRQWQNLNSSADNSVLPAQFSSLSLDGVANVNASISDYIWNVTCATVHCRESPFSNYINFTLGNSTHQVQSLTLGALIKYVVLRCLTYTLRFELSVRKDLNLAIDVLGRLSLINTLIRREFSRHLSDSDTWRKSHNLRRLFSQYINITHATVLSKRHFNTRQFPKTSQNINDTEDIKTFALVNETRHCLPPVETFEDKVKLYARWKGEFFRLKNERNKVIFDIYLLLKGLLNWTTQELLEWQKRPCLATLLQSLPIKFKYQTKFTQNDVFYAKRYLPMFVDLKEGLQQPINFTQFMRRVTILKYEELRFWAPEKNAIEVETDIQTNIRKPEYIFCQLDWLQELKQMRDKSQHDGCQSGF